METVTQVFEEIKNAMCNDFCRYPREWNEEEQGQELCESDVCSACPLNRL